jgi:hypothetical protein
VANLNVTIANNTSSLGGGIYNLGITHLTNVTLATNTVSGSGGVYTTMGTVTGTGGEIRTIKPNDGGGIYNARPPGTPASA